MAELRASSREKILPADVTNKLHPSVCVCNSLQCGVHRFVSRHSLSFGYSPTPHLRSGSSCLLSFELLRSLGFGRWFLCVTCPGASCLATSSLLPGATHAALPLLPSPAASLHPHTLSSSVNYHARGARAASGHSTLSLPPPSTSCLAERSASPC